MNKLLIHLSDIHFKDNFAEDSQLVLNAFFDDIKTQIGDIPKDNVYLAFSGDIVMEGSNKRYYDEFFNYFDTKLKEIGIDKSNRICVPGNHDLSRDEISKRQTLHNALVAAKYSEKEFNSIIANPDEKNIFQDKFQNYLDFQNKFCDIGISHEEIEGKGHSIDDSIGIYCLNSALFSSGGLNNTTDNNLLVATRNIYSWLQENNSKIKILITHHPIDFLSGWAKNELEKIINSNFTLCIYGHAHEQNLFHMLNENKDKIRCAAPQLFSSKADDLGYAMINISNFGLDSIVYRQYSKRHNAFVAGTLFSGTENGAIELSSSKNIRMLISEELTYKLENSLESFSNMPKHFIEPTISKKKSLSKNLSEDPNKINLTEFISKPTSAIIKAPPQFGLTTLSRYMIKEAWDKNNSIWIYIDANTMKLHKLDDSISHKIKSFQQNESNIKCIILDSFSIEEKNSVKLLEKLDSKYSNIPIIIMESIEDCKKNELDFNINRTFEILYLLPLSREHIRPIVGEFLKNHDIGNESIVLKRLVSDFEILNIHRTPLNCFTLLKALEYNFDENPINRTQVIEKILFILFNIDSIPKYATKPDLKDVSFVLGHFCYEMIKNETYTFTKDDFIKKLNGYCEKQLILLENDIVFSVLFDNKIIVKKYDNKFGFRFRYWIYYFIATGMKINKEIATFILSDKNYTSYPDIVEFYTGIDRNREDVLSVLKDDITNLSALVKDKCNLPDDFNPYEYAKWVSTPESLNRMENDIKENVLKSNLPDVIKDRYHDKHYNEFTPYNQSISKIMQEYSLFMLSQTMCATSRALRNSDYVNVNLKQELIKLILDAWKQVSKVIFAISPMLAERSEATFDGTLFTLSENNFSNDKRSRLFQIWNAIPSNIVDWFKNDLFSTKMMPLILDSILNSEDPIVKHELILMIIYERPNGWVDIVKSYINSVNKNSYYLMDIMGKITNQYKYSYAEKPDIKHMEYLIKMIISKHSGSNHPSTKNINKISDRCLPTRQVNNSTGIDM